MSVAAAAGCAAGVGWVLVAGGVAPARRHGWPPTPTRHPPPHPTPVAPLFPTHPSSPASLFLPPPSHTRRSGLCACAAQGGRRHRHHRHLQPRGEAAAVRLEACVSCVRAVYIVQHAACCRNAGRTLSLPRAARPTLPQQIRRQGGAPAGAARPGTGKEAHKTHTVPLAPPCHTTLPRRSNSAVKEVHLLGRRGPAQAAFTPKELRELLSLKGVQVGGGLSNNPLIDWLMDGFIGSFTDLHPRSFGSC